MLQILGGLIGIATTDVISSVDDDVDSIANGHAVNFIRIAIPNHPFFNSSSMGDLCFVFVWDANTKYYLHFKRNGGVLIKTKTTAWQQISFVS